MGESIGLSSLFGDPEENAAKAFQDAGNLFGHAPEKNKATNAKVSPGGSKLQATSTSTESALWEIHPPGTVSAPGPEPARQKAPATSTGTGTVVEGFASLFQTTEAAGGSGASDSAGAGFGQSLPWNRSGSSPLPTGQGSIANPTLSDRNGGLGDPPAPESNWSNPNPTDSLLAGDASKRVSASLPRPLPVASEKPKRQRVLSPLVLTVMVLGALFLGGIFTLRKFGGVEGTKKWALGLLREYIGNAEDGQKSDGTVPPQTSMVIPRTATITTPAPQPPTASGDQPVPATPANPAPDPVPAAGGSAIQAEPDPLNPQATPSAAVSAPDPSEVDPFIPPATSANPATVADAPPGGQVIRPDIPAPRAQATTTELKPAAAAAPQPQAQSQSPAQTPSVQPENVSISPKLADPSPQAAAVAPATTSGDPGEKIAPLLESIGTEVLKSFYKSESVDGRASYVISPTESQPLMEAYYRRFPALPTMKSISFRQPMRDNASGRWFGVFDVQENENDEVHRWCVVQIRPGELKLDWVIYQQLTDQSLDRFLADPAAPPKSFLLVVRPGDLAPAEENPWQGKTGELHLNTPLDTAQARVVLVKESDVVRLELDTALAAGTPRIGRLELMWTQSEVEPGTRVPTVSRVLGWGAW